ncbi:MAG: NitT/TauT family transport system substrate-binding protein [Bacillota bacterium]|nr:MAG: NitT/TauT family transport system substrate-binding protein [Bacillota bacterium]
MRKLLVFMALAAMLISVLTLGGCKKEKTVTDIVLSEVIHSIFYTPQYVALHKGFFLEEGLNVRIDVANGADKGAAALLSGSAQVALFGSEAAVYTWNQGAGNPIIAFGLLCQKDGSFLVGREQRDDFAWTETRGKVIIGGRKGGVPQMVLEHSLLINGLNPQKDVEIVQNIGLTATAAAFKEGIGDYLQVWEPGASLLVKTGAGYVVTSMSKTSGILPYTVFHATKSYMEKNPSVIENFTRAIYKAQLWVHKSSASDIAKTIAPSFPDMDQSHMAEIIERYKILGVWAANPILPAEALDNLQNLMIQAGELTVKVPYEKVVNTTFAQKAVEAIK